MRISRKVLVLNITLAIISVLLVFIVGHKIWNAGYLTLEENDVRDNTNRAYQAWEEEVDVLASRVSDWAPWDDLYAFAKDPENSDFEKKNLEDDAMEILKIDMVILADPEGNIIYAKELTKDKKKARPISKEISSHVKKINKQLPEEIGREKHLKGFIMLTDYPALVSAQRISTSELKGPSPGVLIFIRNADAEYVKKIAKRVQVEMVFVNNNEDSATEKKYWQKIYDENHVKGYQVITDIYGNEGYLLETTMSRDIYQHGQQQMNDYATLTLLFGVGITVITLILFEYFVLKRLRKLDGFMRRIGDDGNLFERLYLSGNDEFSRTADTMNHMLDQVQETQNTLRKLSLYDGLTGLYNRNFFKQEINKIVDKHTWSVGIISCDVDGLKFVNDTLGHSVGDEMLVKMSHSITQVVGDQGKAIRMGAMNLLYYCLIWKKNSFLKSADKFKNCYKKRMSCEMDLLCDCQWGGSTAKVSLLMEKAL